MGSINRSSHIQKIFTHEGRVAKHISPENQLRRSVLSCLLGEKEFYEDGQSITDRIKETAAKCSPHFVYDLAMEARHTHGLRHVPLILLLDLISRKDPVIKDADIGMSGYVSKEHRNQDIIKVKHAIANVIRRPDEMTELLALYWADKKNQRKLSDRQFRDGLALAFCKFNEYSLAKYNRDGPVRMRDVMFLSHPKPKNEEQAVLFKKVAQNKLDVPDTWEVELSAGKDKKETFERLIREGKLGYLALLRNLRGMAAVDVDRGLITDAIRARKGAELVFPFRYVAAARAAPQFEPILDEALQANIKEAKKLSGHTLVFVDVSRSMRHQLSARSDLTRMDAAATLASVIPSDDLRVFSFSDRNVEVPPRKGMAGVETIVRSQPHSGTQLADAIRFANTLRHDRLIFITDEQAHGGWNRTSGIPDPVCKNSYMINVASARNGVGYGKWVHLDGFSESIIRYTQVIEEIREEK